MPTFDTPEPLDAHITNAAGDISVTATDTASTTVEVSAEAARDQEAAEQTIVEVRDGQLRIEVPRSHGWGQTPEIDVKVTIPAHSSVEIESASADTTLTGTYDTVRVRTASGDVRLDTATGPARIETASGDVSFDEAHGPVQINTASGDVRLGSALGDDPVEVSTASGDAEIGSVHGPLTVGVASSDIRVREAAGDVNVSSASGDVTLDHVHSGKVGVSSASGDVRVGIPTGVATWLDLHSLSGDIGTDQANDNGPVEGEATLELRANTVSGDIRLHRVG
ncbi:MAG TPA: DUF4097 family beta strand repeat-containing protein [Actinopolymorphaceae bacterium]|jgi:DUF4097 and DUF4098 domain-containing protein YvlB